MALLQGFSFIAPWLIFPYVFAALMPSWRWLLVCALAGGGGFSYLWIDHWLAMQRPDYHEGAGGALGIVLFGAATMSFTVGVAVRAISLFVWARGYRAGAFWIAVFGVVVPFAVLEAPQALHAWRYRPAPKACTERGFPIDIGDNRFNIPAEPLFAIYRGRSVVADAYYLFSAPHLRALCNQAAGGTLRVHATSVAINFDRIGQWKSSVCGVATPSASKEFVPHDPPRWAGQLCTAVGPANVHTMDPTEFPLRANVYSLREVKPGEFSASSSSYEDSLKPPLSIDRGETYTTTDTRTSDGHPLTFACRVQSDGSRWCTTSYPWLNGVHLHYAFRTKDEQYAEKGQRIDETLRAFLTQFQASAP